MVPYGPARQPFDVLGQFSARLTKAVHPTDSPIYVVKSNLLSLQMLAALQLVRWVNTTVSRDQDVKKKFPKVFQGVRSTWRWVSHQIRRRWNSVHELNNVPHNIPIPLRSKVRQSMGRLCSHRWWGKLKNENIQIGIHCWLIYTVFTDLDIIHSTAIIL